MANLDDATLRIAAASELPPVVQTCLLEMAGQVPFGTHAIEAKSAQHTVFVVVIGHHNDDTLKSRPPLQRGNGRLVLRIWKSGARWWNLHKNTCRELLSRSELAGYAIARCALTGVSFSPSNDTGLDLRIPELIFASRRRKHDDDDADNWACFEYVGPQSTLFGNATKATTDCTFWTDSMIKTRHEFGFDEPHPRWGRVPVNVALEYALLVLRQVVIPVHRYCRNQLQSDGPARVALASLDGYSMGGHTHASMVNYYAKTLADVKSNAAVRHHADTLIDQVLDSLENAIIELQQMKVADWDPVLCHMDLQPQNLLFHTRTAVAAVLDWEDAAWADPRFELLMLGRKVVACREQAAIVWTIYGDAMQTSLGPLEPWLALETTHSLLTLLQQSLNLLHGGRNPWEQQSDLRGKLQRELSRLHEHLTTSSR